MLPTREPAPAGANADMRRRKTSGGFWGRVAAVCRAAVEVAVEAVRSLVEGLVSGFLGGREHNKPADVPTRIEIA